MEINGIMIITALPRPFLSLHVTGNKHSINGGLKGSQRQKHKHCTRLQTTVVTKTRNGTEQRRNIPFRSVTKRRNSPSSADLEDRSVEKL